jgi:SPP1 family predicted phage head-tail adaptor
MIGDNLDAQGLTRRVRIERQVVTHDAAGGDVISYVLRAEVNAAVLQTRGREAFLSAQVVPTADIEFRIRWRSDVVETDRVVYEGKNYNIQYLAEMGRRRRLRIAAKLLGAEVAP